MAERRAEILEKFRREPDRKVGLLGKLDLFCYALFGVAQLPFSIFYYFVIQRWPRHFSTMPFTVFIRWYLAYTTVAQKRVVVGPILYDLALKAPVPATKEYSSWLKFVKDEKTGVEGRWIAEPGTDRSDDDVVLYYIHGGGFVIDSGGASQNFFFALLKYMREVKKVKFSIFQLHYALAPEHPFPSSSFEALEGYKYLLGLGIDASKICISGDSAGGNAVLSALLMKNKPYEHPATGLKIGEDLVDLPSPGSAFLISPYLGFSHDSPSRSQNEKYDTIDSSFAISASLGYVGYDPPHRSAFFSLLFPRRTTLSSQLASFSPKDASAAQALLSSPYVDPLRADPVWMCQSLPKRVLVTVGEKEGLRDDIEAWINAVESVVEAEREGVTLQVLNKPDAIHDWVLSDWTDDKSHLVKTEGKHNEKFWSLEIIADFILGQKA